MLIYISAVLIVLGLFDLIAAVGYFIAAAFQLVFGVIPALVGWVISRRPAHHDKRKEG